MVMVVVMVEVLVMGLIVGFDLVVVSEHFALTAVALSLLVVLVVPLNPLDSKFMFRNERGKNTCVF